MLALEREWLATGLPVAALMETVGQRMADSPAGSVLMVDPQSPASLLAALKQFQQGKS